jgi:FixJ family two-component response regulator
VKAQRARAMEKMQTESLAELITMIQKLQRPSERAT